MPTMTQDLTLATRDGGNFAGIVQLDIDTDGTYIARTTSDVFGATAGTLHLMGNFTDSSALRQTDGSYKFEFTGMEQDLIRHNALELMAPVSSADTSGDQVVMEDNTAKVGSQGSSFDSNKPVFAIFYFFKKLNGKWQVRHAIVQANPDGGRQAAKAKQWNQWKWGFYSIDANGSDAVEAPDNDNFTGITIGALASPYQHGKVFQQT